MSEDFIKARVRYFKKIVTYPYLNIVPKSEDELKELVELYKDLNLKQKKVVLLRLGFLSKVPNSYIKNLIIRAKSISKKDAELELAAGVPIIKIGKVYNYLLDKGKKWKPENNNLNNISYKIISENCRIFIEATDSNKDVLGKRMISTNNFINIVESESSIDSVEAVCEMRKLYEDEEEVFSEREIHEYYIPSVKSFLVEKYEIEEFSLAIIEGVIISACAVNNNNYNTRFDIEGLAETAILYQNC